MIQYTTKFSHPAVTNLQRLSAQHNIELAELFQNLDVQSKQYAELIAKLDTYFQEDRNAIMTLQTNDNTINSCIDIMANTITEQLPSVIQSYFQAHNINKDTVNEISRFCQIMKSKI